MRPLTLFLGTAVLCMFSSLHADIYTVEGEMSSTVTAYLTKRFKSGGDVKGLTYTLHLPSTTSEGLNTQLIDSVARSTVPHPTEMVELVDEYGNQVVKMRWNKSIRVVQIDMQFTTRLYSNFYPLRSESPYPVPVSEELKPYLSSSTEAPAGNYVINFIASSLAKGQERELDVVANIFLWLDRNITLNKANSQYDALNVLRSKCGTEQGICNLASALLKGIGIPVRVVYGVSFQREIQLEAGEEQIYYDYPNGERYWIEVFFPDTGWVSYDPLGTHFAATSHLIKIAVGPDASYASDSWKVESGSVEFTSDYIYDVLEDSSTLLISDVQPGHKKMVLRSPIDFLPKHTQPSLEIESGEEHDTDLKEKPIPTERVSIGSASAEQRLNVTATTTRIYAQRVVVEDPLYVTDIRLPLIKFSDEGSVWVELYNDLQHSPGKILYRTLRLSSPRIRFMMIENPWLNFPFQDAPLLSPGQYWIVLRSSGSCIFNWNACGGNIYGDEADTRFLDLDHQDRLWKNLVNIDLNFQITGRPKKNS